MSTRHISRKFINALRKDSLDLEAFKHKEIKRLIYIVLTGKLKLTNGDMHEFLTGIYNLNNANYFMMIAKYDYKLFITSCFVLIIKLFKPKTVIYFIKNWVRPISHNICLHIALEYGRTEYASFIYEMSDKMVNTTLEPKPENKNTYSISLIFFLLKYKSIIEDFEPNDYTEYSFFHIAYITTFIIGLGQSDDRTVKQFFKEQLSPSNFNKVNELVEFFEGCDRENYMTIQVIVMIQFMGDPIISKRHFDMIDVHPEFLVFAPPNLQKLYIKKKYNNIKYLPNQSEFLEVID